MIGFIGGSVVPCNLYYQNRSMSFFPEAPEQLHAALVDAGGSRGVELLTPPQHHCTPFLEYPLLNSGLMAMVLMTSSRRTLCASPWDRLRTIWVVDVVGTVGSDCGGVGFSNVREAGGVEALEWRREGREQGGVGRGWWRRRRGTREEGGRFLLCHSSLRFYAAKDNLCQNDFLCQKR